MDINPANGSHAKSEIVLTDGIPSLRFGRTFLRFGGGMPRRSNAGGMNGGMLPICGILGGKGKGGRGGGIVLNSVGGGIGGIKNPGGKFRYNG